MKTSIAAILIVLMGVSHSAAAQRPNVLIIVSDDQGYRDLGCFGSEEVKTPHLDRLAAAGVRLTSFYVTWPACTPSRGSLLTGRYPQRNGTYDMFRNDLVDFGVKYDKYRYAVSPEMIGGMDTREVMIPHILKEGGYRSGIFGKWDLGQLKRFLPLACGFDEFYGFANTGIDYFTHERYYVPSMRRGNSLTTEDKGTYCTYLFQREAVRFLKENKDKQFFLYVPFNAPHGSSSLDPAIRGTVQAPEKYIGMYPQPKSSEKSEKGKKSKKRNKAVRRVGYMAACTCMDDAIGKLLDLLDKYDLAQNTLVIFFSDNGGSGLADNSPLRGHKGRMFEGGIRVPCIVRFPGRIPAGTVSDEFLTSLEIFPTVLKAVGLKPPEDVVLDGFDMMPVLAGKTKSKRTEMYWQRRGDRAARVGKWKWVESAKGSGLFDLAEDIGEKHDLSTEKPAILKMLKAKFADWKKQMDEAEPRRPFRDF